MKKKQVIRRKSNVIPKYEIGGVTYGEDISKELLKLKLADEDKSALGYGIDYGMQGMSAGSGFGGIGGTTGSLIMGGVGLVGGLLDGIINGKKDAEASNREQRKGVIDTMQANMYSGSTSVNNPLGQTVRYPYGGMMQPNAEVEGGEVLKQPNGQVNTMQGPSHAQGGIDVNAPQGTKVYSDRIKHKVGNKYETYAETAAKLNKILDKYKKVDKNEDTLKKNSDALMIARIQQKLDNLFDEQEVQKNIQGIEQPEQQTMAYGGITERPPFDEWYKTVPATKNDTSNYNLRRAYDLAPQEQLDAFVNDPNAHLNSVYENKQTGNYEFMKSKNHPTLKLELDWYNSNENNAIDFKNKYSLDTNGDYYKYVPKKKLMMDQSGPYNKKLEMNQTGPYYQKLMMDQTKRQINPSQLKFAYGGTTGWPIKNYESYKENQEYFDSNKGQTEDVPMPDQMQSINANIPLGYQNMNIPYSQRNWATSKSPYAKAKQLEVENTNNSLIKKRFDAMTNGKWDYSLANNNTVPIIQPKSVNLSQTPESFINSYKMPMAPVHDNVDGLQERKKTDWAGIGSTALEAAPMIYNLLQKKPDQMPTAPYMDTQMVTPERMSNEQDLREAERNYSAMVNDKSLPVAQRLLASRQLQSTKAQILQQTENQYKQDVNRAQEVNAAKIHKNIDTAMKIKDINDANIGAYANQRAQAMGDISQLAQKKTLEKNMAKKNDVMFKALQSAFPDYSFKSDGTIVHKSGKPLTPEQLEALNKYKQNLYYTSMIKSGSYIPQYNESYYNQIGNTLKD